jgi:hypothetical protein
LNNKEAPTTIAKLGIVFVCQATKKIKIPKNIYIFSLFLHPFLVNQISTCAKKPLSLNWLSKEP